MGDLIEGRFGTPANLWVTKKQLAAHPQVRRSTRWIEQRVAEGLPSRMDGHHRVFPLTAALEWIETYRDGRRTSVEGRGPGLSEGQAAADEEEPPPACA